VSDAGEPTNSVINPPETNGLTIAGFFGTLIVSFGGRVTSLLTAGGNTEGGDFFGETGIRSEIGGCTGIREGRTDFGGEPGS
jgi:hypothetical protein